ncbi:Serine acetyltransferase [Gemmata sp. SH-PL17]|uniref:serine O-acetyltransferase n=1 Tax=Gemmata sp. SH-PL17 TaxID=1630693 RepID=UPI0004ACFDE0|nr:serine acetyltransferase [Gemmata sp. SH-PL17]AMV30098.1 Serine acetyltransferase [Gemmata sp. SH-PL17]
MATDVRLKEELPTITDQLVETYTECSRLNHLAHEPLPNRDAVAGIVTDLFEVLYPGYGKRQNLHIGNIGYYVGSLIDALHDKLTTQIARALRHELCHERDSTTESWENANDDKPHVDCEKIAQPKAVELLRRLADVRKTLELDVEAAFRGDPAARSHHEIIFCYPGLEAITVYRVAHELHGLGIPFIPRMMTELAHAKTGIDIHPGATIGPGFFIDHGTGVVIGETCHIGRGVKLYQGVTLGALSFTKDDDGALLHGNYKRHPTLEDGVVVYANATILGGQTVIGTRAVVGSNVWLTESVPPDTTVVLEKPKLRLKGAKPVNEPLTYEI